MDIKQKEIEYNSLVMLYLIKTSNSSLKNMFEEMVGDNYGLYFREIESNLFKHDETLKMLFDFNVLGSKQMVNKYYDLSNKFEDVILQDNEPSTDSKTKQIRTKKQLEENIQLEGEETDWHRAIRETLELKNFYKRLQTNINKKDLTDSQLRRITNFSKIFKSNIDKLLNE